jgi:hypothetical protein
MKTFAPLKVHLRCCTALSTEGIIAGIKKISAAPNQKSNGAYKA